MKKLALPVLVAAGVLMLGSSSAEAATCKTDYYGSKYHRSYHHDYGYWKPWWKDHRRAYRYQRPYRPYYKKVVHHVPANTVINIPNSNGSYTPVELRREGGLYVGPKGEYYTSLPSVDQLKQVYGLDYIYSQE